MKVGKFPIEFRVILWFAKITMETFRHFKYNFEREKSDKHSIEKVLALFCFKRNRIMLTPAVYIIMSSVKSKNMRNKIFIQNIVYKIIFGF